MAAVPFLHSVLLLTPSLAQATAFYCATLGLPMVASRAGWARLSLGGDPGSMGTASAPCLLLQEAPAAAAAAHANASADANADAAPAAEADERAAAAAPVLQLSVPAAGDFDALVPALLAAGAALHGPVRYAPTGRLAVLRAPAGAGGHFLSVRQEDELA